MTVGEDSFIQMWAIDEKSDDCKVNSPSGSTLRPIYNEGDAFLQGLPSGISFWLPVGNTLYKTVIPTRYQEKDPSGRPWGDAFPTLIDSDTVVSRLEAYYPLVLAESPSLCFLGSTPTAAGCRGHAAVWSAVPQRGRLSVWCRRL